MKTKKKDDEKETAIVEKLHSILKPFLLRRVKSEVEKNLLPKKELYLYTGMSEMQIKWYKKLLEKDIAAVNGVVEKSEGQTRLLNIVMQLRKCCNHPYLFNGAEPGPPFTTDEHLIDNCDKLKLLDKLLKFSMKAGSRVLIFSQMSRMLDILEDYCIFRNFEYCRIDGSTDHQERIQAIDEYNAPNSKKFAFLLTTRAGGLGINLVTADTVIIYDSDWNPQVDLQAQDRAHRIGQTKQVKVFRLVTDKSIEEKVLEKALQKLRLDQLVIQQGKLAQQQKNPNKNQLLEMLRHGANELFNMDSSSFKSQELDIEEIFKQSDKKTKELNEKYAVLGIEDLKKFTIGNNTESTYVWEGEDYRKKHVKHDVDYWITPGRRERRQNLSTIVEKKPDTHKLPKPPKQITLYDFQFYPLRLRELHEKEMFYYKKTINTVVHNSSDYEDEEDPELEKKKEEQKKIDQALPLTEEEKLEKEELQNKGFSNWYRRDFNNFVRAIDTYGPEDIESISKSVEGKEPQEVIDYYNVFWQRYGELSNSNKIITTIKRAKARMESQQKIQQFLTKLLEEYEIPILELQFNYGQQKSKYYTLEEDRFIVVCVQKLGYTKPGVFNDLRREIMNCPMFRFDWFFRSKNPFELNKRFLSLVHLLMKDRNMPLDILTNLKNN